MAKKDAPVALADSHPAMRQPHVPPAVIHWSAGVRAQEIYQQLLLAHDAVFGAVLPKSAELCIVSQPRQQVVCHRSDRVVAAEPLVKSLLLVAHGSSSRAADDSRPMALRRRRTTSDDRCACDLIGVPSFYR